MIPNINVLGTLIDGVGGSESSSRLIVHMYRSCLKLPMRNHGRKDVPEPQHLLGCGTGRNVLGLNGRLGSASLLGRPPMDRLVVVGDQHTRSRFAISVVAGVVRIRVAP